MRQVESVLENLSKKDIDRIKTLSASKISTWLRCRMEFFFRYIAHEAEKDKVSLLFGRSIHSALDRFYNMNYKSAESFANQWSWQWMRQIAGDNLKGKKKESLEVRVYPTFSRNRDEGLKIGDHIDFGPFAEDGKMYLEENGKKVPHIKVNICFGYLSLGKSILKRFYNRHKNKPAPAYREYRKKVDIFGVPTIVVFDRIDKFKDGRWAITDYKTDKREPDIALLHQNIQFTIYSYAAREIFKDEFENEESGIFYYHLRSGKVFKTQRDKRDFEYLKRLILRVSEEIDHALRTGDFIAHYGYHCTGCRFYMPCQEYVFRKTGPRKERIGGFRTLQSFDEWENLVETFSQIEE